MTKVLTNLPPEKKNPSFLPIMTARVVTSEECRQEINEKERKKAEALRMKKVQREQKRKVGQKKLEELKAKKVNE